jgi:TRAP-type C4-dicarboxylate transport system permease small subunit
MPSGFRKAVLSCESFIARLENILMSISLGMLTVIMFVSVICRYFLKAPLFWADELTRFLFLWSIFVGMGYSHYLREHIIVDYFYSRMSPKAQRFLDLLNNLILAALFITLLPASWSVASVYTRTLPSLPIKGTYKFLSCTVGIGLMLFHQLAFLFGPKRRKEED